MNWVVVLVLIIIITVYLIKQKQQQSEKIQTEPVKSKLPRVRVRVFEGRWDVNKVQSRPKCLFVFGDNEDEVGRGGQAVIRDEPNAIGIPTKLRPYMSEESFYNDEQIEDNKSAILEAIEEIRDQLSNSKYNCLMFPESGLGTGRSQLPRKAPKTYQYLLSQLFELAREYDPEGASSTSPSSWGPWIKFLYENTQYESASRQRISV